MSSINDLAAMIVGPSPDTGPPLETRFASGTVTYADPATSLVTVTLAGGASVILPSIGPTPPIGGVVLIAAYGPVRVVLGTFSSGSARHLLSRSMASTFGSTATAITSVTGWTMTNVIKAFAGSSLEIDLYGSTWFVGGVVGLVSVYALINGADYLLGQNYFNALGDHRPMAIKNRVAGGLAAGTYSVQIRVAVTSGQTINFDTNDQWVMDVAEVLP